MNFRIFRHIIIIVKIFGIGLSRTGTTSLNKALEILGYKSIHWPSNNQILTDICDGRFKWDILQTYDALTDIHGAAFYREFDKEYLNSKFILT
ncbi:MAG: hypothetical protein GTO02_01590, partial [Candidatus Dadabacteria bacterium]|nr:hypothetical protein [Candidatus Dadabacteria bacterium]